MRPRLFDCFLFFNELDLLEIRLNEMDPVVDVFVIAEATHTFTGKPKPLYFEENEGRFARFRDKIRHVVIRDDTPEMESWARERFQRDALRGGLHDARPDDLVLLSDVDEIVSARALAPLRDRPIGSRDIVTFELRWFFFFFNLERAEKWLRKGPRLTRYANLRDMESLRDVRGPVDAKGRDMVRGLRAAIGMRRIVRRRVVRDAGWHFTWLGGVEAVVQKAASISSHSRLPPDLATAKVAAAQIDSAVSGSDPYFHLTGIDATFPRYLVDNLDRFSHLIHEDDQGQGSPAG